VKTGADFWIKAKKMAVKQADITCFTAV